MRKYLFILIGLLVLNLPPVLYGQDMVLVLQAPASAPACEAGSEDLLPNGDTTTDIPACTGGECPSHYAVINEAYASPSTTDYVYINYTNGTYLDEYTVADTASMGEGCTGGTITVYVYARELDSDSGADALTVDIGTGGAWEGQQQADVTTSWAWHTFNFTSTGWSKAQVDAMSVRVTLDSDNSSTWHAVATVVIRVNYS